ncbi:MAG: hypothetical protein JWO09_896 [Bacteroidetes bacterium]|nr:hypothetical protein [Bacteroidota bacterium]
MESKDLLYAKATVLSPQIHRFYHYQRFFASLRFAQNDKH